MTLKPGLRSNVEPSVSIVFPLFFCLMVSVPLMLGDEYIHFFLLLLCLVLFVLLRTGHGPLHTEEHKEKEKTRVW